MINPMPCLASLFDAMSGVKKLPNFHAVINCPTSAFEPSNEASFFEVGEVIVGIIDVSSFSDWTLNMVS